MQEINKQKIHHQTQRQKTVYSRNESTLRKQISLPVITEKMHVKQLYPCKSWNELARQTEEKKKKRKLNNELKNELGKFFEQGQIVIEPVRTKSRNQRSSNKRVSTQKNQSLNKKSSESLQRHNKPPPIKIEQKQGTFIPRKGLKPPQFLADLDIQDSSSQAFRSIIPQSPMTPASIQRSTPKQTPRSHIVPSRLNSGKYSQNNRQTGQNRYATQPDSPVDQLIPLCTQNSQIIDDEQNMYYQQLRLQGDKYSDQIKQQTKKNKDEYGIPDNQKRNNINYFRNPKQQNHDEQKNSHVKNIKLLKEMQRSLGFQQDNLDGELQQEIVELQMNNMDYLRRPNQLEIIDQEDEKSFNQRIHRDSFAPNPLQIVEEKHQSEAEENKNSLREAILIQQNLTPVGSHNNLQVQSQIIRHCSSKQLLKQDLKQSLPQIDFSSFSNHNFKKKQSNILQISHSSIKSKQQKNLPLVQVISVSNHKTRINNQYDFDMSPIQRSKASCVIPDQHDSSISKEFGNQWFTPKHERKSQSIEKLSPIYDQMNRQQKEQKQLNFIQKSNQLINKYPNNPFSIQYSQPEKQTMLTYQSFNQYSINPQINVYNNYQYPSFSKQNFNNPATNLTIKYPQSSIPSDQKNSHTLKVTRKINSNKVGSLNPNIDFNQLKYSGNTNCQYIQKSSNQQIDNKNLNSIMTQPNIRFNKQPMSEQWKLPFDTPSEISKKFNLNFSPLPSLNLNTTPLSTPIKNHQKSNTSYIPNDRSLDPRKINLTPSSSPLNSNRPSQRTGIMTQRNSVSSKKGIRLWINNFNEQTSRSKSPVSQRLNSIKRKQSLQKVRNIDKSIIQSRSKQKNTKRMNYSPISKTNHFSSNMGSTFEPEYKKSTMSPTKSIIRLGNKNSFAEQPQQPTVRKGIKLSCQFKKHKYQQKGVVAYLN